MPGERSWQHRSAGFAPERAPLAAPGPGPRCRASCFSRKAKQHLRIFSEGDEGQSPSLAEPSSVQTRNTCFSRNHFLPLTFLLFLLTQDHIPCCVSHSCFALTQMQKNVLLVVWGLARLNYPARSCRKCGLKCPTLFLTVSI